ncbi:hypothetical protein A8U91_00321 [Halomonas elongata]|uniref:Uncharacterized protein n=1 Tax=Halomonas elongata TaxID=2746 RepID=A0A1B8P139_HALEL|nr:hypothetical protein A8U91_00321 [Halomonas elongata]
MARRDLVDATRHQFLAGTGFALQQYRQVGLGGTHQLIAQRADGRRLTENASPETFAEGAPACAVIEFGQRVTQPCLVTAFVVLADQPGPETTQQRFEGQIVVALDQRLDTLGGPCDGQHAEPFTLAVAGAQRANHQPPGRGQPGRRCLKGLVVQPRTGLAEPQGKRPAIADGMSIGMAEVVAGQARRLALLFQPTTASVQGETTYPGQRQALAQQRNAAPPQLGRRAALDQPQRLGHASQRRDRCERLRLVAHAVASHVTRPPQ